MEHISSYKQLFLVLLALFLCTFLTVYISRFDFGAFNVWIALLIAATKGTLVLMYFMHLRYESKTLTYMLTSSLFFLAIMISFLFFDISFR